MNEYTDLLQPGAREENPYRQMLQRQREWSETAFRSSVSTGIEAKPDQVGISRRVAGYLGTSPAAVEALPDEAMRAAKLKQIEESTADAPATRRAYTDADFARLAHDDSQNLSFIERTVRAVLGGERKAPEVGPQNAVVTSQEFAKLVRDTMARNPALGADAARAMLSQRYSVDNTPGGVRAWSAPPTTLSSLVGGLGSMLREGLVEQSRQGIRRFAGDMLGLDTVAADAQRMNRQSMNRQFLATPQPEGLAGDLYGGLQSTVASTPAIVAGFYSSPAALAAFFAQTAAPAYSKYRDRGGSIGESSLGAGLEGIAEVLGEKIPLDYMVKRFGRAGMSEFIAGMLAREIPSEVATTIAQTATDTAIANPGKTWGDWARELPAEIRQTVIGTLVQSGVFGGAGALARRFDMRAQEAQQAEIRAEAFTKLNELAAASKVMERDPASFEKFAEGLNGGDIYIDANALMQSGIAEQVAQASPSVAEQLPLAAASGGTIRIPLSEYTARIAPTDLGPVLIEDLKDSPNGFSRREAQEYMQSQGAELQAEVDRLVQDQEKADTFKAQVDEVKAAIRQELDTAGRWRGEVNDAYASMVARFFATMGSRVGVSPSELYQRYRLTVASRMAVGDGVLNQPVTKESVDAIAQSIRGQRGVDTLDLRLLPNGDVRLDTIATRRVNTGAGTAAMNDLVAWADTNGVRLTLSLAEKGYQPIEGGPKTTSPGRLRSFYKRFGFVDNVGRSKDFSLNDSMYRPPRALNQANYGQTDTRAFKAWSEGLPVIRADQTEDYEGGAAVFEAYHGTTHTGIEVVDPRPESGTSEGHLGKGFYLTTSKEDASTNYAGEGPDLTGRIERRFEEIGSATYDDPYVRDELLSDYFEANPAAAKDVAERLDVSLQEFDYWDLSDEDKEVAQQMALDDAGRWKARLEVSGESLGLMMPLWVKVKNPLDIRPDGMVIAYEVEYDDEGDVVNESGPLIDLAEALRNVASDYNIDVDEMVGSMLEDGPDGISAYKFWNLGQKHLGEAYDDNGNLLSPGDIMRQAAEQAGYDGIVMDADLAFGTQRRGFGGARIPGMEGVEPGTLHIMPFSAKQVKSSIGNRGTFDPNDPNILNQNTAGAPRASFNPSTNTITLAAQSDLSSFLHESGHFFLETMFSIASEAQGRELQPGEQEVIDDATALLKWFGVPGLDVWNNLDFEEKRAYHEKFAVGFEKYLFEGRTPSIELHSLFQRFRAWLLGVYRDIKALGVELDDTVRGVMDRMLATNEEIKLAEQARSMMPLFDSAEQSGMTPDEWAAYQREQSEPTLDAIEDLQAKGLRDMQWLNNARSREIRRLKKLSAERRREIRMEVRAEVMSQPVYRAWQFLTDKPGEQPTGKIDRAALDAMGIPKEITDHIRRLRMTADEGLHPDVIAEQFGFTSGDELIRTLAAAQKPNEEIEGLTDAAMLERYGELADMAAIEREADRAIHSDARAKFVATEHNALAKAIGRPKILASAAKQFAAETIARLKVRNIRPGQYASAAARAGKNAAKAMQSKDLESAAAEKRNQVVNTYLAKSANDAQVEVEKALRYLRKFDGGVKTIDPEYHNQIDQLLERFEFRRRSERQLWSDLLPSKRKPLAEWIEDQRRQGLDPDIPSELLNAAERTSYHEMTLEQMRGLVDTVKQIEHLGRLKNRLLTARDKREYEAVRDQIAASIREHGGKARPLKLEPDSRVVRWVNSSLAEHRKFASLVRQMDGGVDAGPMWDALVRPMNERGAWEDVRIEQATMRLAEIYAPLLKLRGGMTGDKQHIPEINNSLSRGGRIAVALNWGNQINRERVMLGDGWSEAQVGAILGRLTSTELEAVNQIWEFIDTYWPEIEAKQKRVFGVAPEKVEADPFTVTSADGKTVQMRGGYYPLKYDSARSSRSESNDRAEVARDMLRGAYTSSTTRRGHTKARAEEVSMPVRKDLGVVTEHITQVVHDLAWHEWLIDANRLMRSNHIGDAVRTHYGADVLTTMKDDIEMIAAGNAYRLDATDRVLRWFRGSIQRSVMGLSFTTAMLQPFGLTNSMARIGVRPVLQGMARWIGDAARFENSMTWIGEKSQMMRLRSKTFNREIHEISNRLAGKSKVMEVFDASLFFLTTKLQMAADIPTWIGRYEQALNEGADEGTAVALADQAVIDAQGSGSIKDLAQVQRKHPMLTQFYSYFSATYNLAAQKTGATDFKNPRAVAGWLADMTLLMVLPALGPAIVLMLLRGEGDDDPEELAKKLLQAQAGYMLGNVVLLREFSGVISGFPYAGPPVGRIVLDIGNFGTQVLQGEVDEAAVMATVRLLGSSFGIPTTQAIRSYRGWEAWASGDAPPTSVLFGPPPRD